jgi:hypothetical protein
MNQERVARLFGHRRVIIQLVAVEKDFDERDPFERALDERFGEPVFDVFLECAPLGAGAVGTVGASLLDDPALRVVGLADF